MESASIRSYLLQLIFLNDSYWGVLREKVYPWAPSSLGGLREAITEEFCNHESDIALRINVCESVCNRMNIRIECNYQNFEYVII